MKKAYSHLAVLVLAAASLSSCSRADYATVAAKSDLATASAVQAPASPAADMSAQVVAAQPLPAATAAPVATPAPVVAAAPVAAPAAPSRVAASAPAPVAARPAIAVAETPAASTPKPSLAQRLAVNKLTKQLHKIEKRQQNTASVSETAARSGSLTILLVGLVALLLGIIIGAGWLTTIGAILAVVGLVLLLLKAL